MKKIRSIIAFIVIIFSFFTSNAQHLEWLVKPVIEQDEFYYFPDMNSEFIIVKSPNGREGVVRKDGTYLYAADRFDKVNLISGNGIMYGMKKDEKAIVFNSKGLVISDKYDWLNSYHHTNILLVNKNNLLGLIDTLGTEIRKPQYKSLRRVKRGLFKGEFPDGRIEMIEVDETDGLTSKQRRAKEKKRRSLVKDRIVIYGKKVKKSSLKYFGLTDLKGDTIFAPDKYYGIRNYEKYGLIITHSSENRKEGAIDKNGNVVIPFKYDYIRENVYKDKYLFANIAKEFFIIDLHGNVKASYKADDMYKMGKYPYFRAINDKMYSILDLDFKPVLNESFKRITDPYRPGWSIILKNKKKGFFSLKTGKYTKPQFTRLTVPLIYNVFGVKTGKYFGLFDVHNGKFVTDTIYSKIQNAGKYFITTIEEEDSVKNDSGYEIKKVNYYSVLDSTYNLVLGPTKNRLSRIAKDMFTERTSKKTLVIRNFKTGETKEFNTIRFFKNNVSKIGNDIYCFTDELLDEDITTFEYLSSVEEHLQSFKRNGKFGLIHNKKVVNIAEFDEIGDIYNGMIKVKKNGKWGILKNPFIKK